MRCYRSRPKAVRRQVDPPVLAHNRGPPPLEEPVVTERVAPRDLGPLGPPLCATDLSGNARRDGLVPVGRDRSEDLVALDARRVSHRERVVVLEVVVGEHADLHAGEVAYSRAAG